jgi:hypothetical protein
MSMVIHSGDQMCELLSIALGWNVCEQAVKGHLGMQLDLLNSHLDLGCILWRNIGQ